MASARFIAELPELGQLNRRAVAASVGVAPMANDSGGTKGRRRVQGGRFEIRRVLYLAALTAARHNPVIRDFYRRLKSTGKLPKVALVACMRKLRIARFTVLRLVLVQKNSSKNIPFRCTGRNARRLVNLGVLYVHQDVSLVTRRWSPLKQETPSGAWLATFIGAEVAGALTRDSCAGPGFRPAAD